MIAYISANLWLAWTIVALVCLVLELSSGDFYVTCFAIGAAVTAIAALTGIPFWLQVIIFAIASVVSIWLIRPALLKWLHKPNEERLSNADALIGRSGEVVEAIPAEGYGCVRIDGDYWKACTADATAIDEGIRVRVVERNSIIITVEKIS